MVLNRGEAPLEVTVTLFDLADNTHDSWVVRDIWQQADLGVAVGSLHVTVPAHGVRFLRMRPQAPPPYPPCPAGFTAHPPGYWHNLELVVKASTVAACAAKCSSGPACKAFEVFLGAGYPGACYNFGHNLTAPFTPAETVTCVKA
eukprot:SAG22_NODE_9_length_35992_cov_37.278104_9_plen_145_part_00